MEFVVIIIVILAIVFYVRPGGQIRSNLAVNRVENSGCNFFNMATCTNEYPRRPFTWDRRFGMVRQKSADNWTGEPYTRAQLWPYGTDPAEPVYFDKCSPM